MKHASLVIASLLLAGCAMQNNSFIHDRPISVAQENVEKTFLSTEISRSELAGIADDIVRRGTSPVAITVDYAATAPLKNAERVAEAQGSRVKSFLAAQGVRHATSVKTRPAEAETVNRITISYEALKAAAPEDCQPMAAADADRYTHNTDGPYRFGCRQKEMISAQIARPGDLLGNDATMAPESQRLGKQLETYRAGEPATPQGADGLTASTVYQN